ncbi:PQQ-binding-like beta-propeller repeat protein [Naasia sp. SYSU D00948]|uniref:PQQ-binding-like beta-propeller repeat protein n=1 Tax=Naasia sp. SYSU D00948 TaxID=2817379 RepID=UPI001B310B2E|nr:PQQ-binding-like beta-propeller repeat protein [Naasia sp. SYSU D00948]
MSGGADGARPRRRLLPAIVVPALLVALTGSLLALDLPTAGEPGGAAARFVPSDGESTRYRMQDGSVRAVDHSRVVGVQGALTGPDVVSSAVIGALGDEGVRSAHFWREITTADEGQYNDLYVLGEDGLRQIASWGGVVGFTFEPGLLLLPSDAAPGAEWSSSGSALGDGALTFESEFRAVAADEQLTGAEGERFDPPDGCLQVEGTLTLEQPGVGPLLTSTDTSVWCPGEGRLFSVGEQNGERIGSVAVRESAPFPPPAEESEGTAEEPEDAEDGRSSGPGLLETLDAVVVDQFFGESIRQGNIVTPPARTPGGLIVTPNEHGDDLLAWRLDDDRAVLAWSAHPGGSIATVSAVGELVVAATEDRAVRAYDERGRRVWSWEGDDLALARAAALPGSRDVLVATRGGTVARLDAGDGRERWSTPLGADTRGEVVAAVGTVVAADERGRVSGLDAQTGELLWREDLGMSAALAAAPSEPLAYLVTEDGELLAVDARTGEVLWEATLTGLVRSIAADATGVVAATDEETVRFDASTGAEQWTAPGSQSVRIDADGRILTLAGDTVALREADGTSAAEWTLPERADPADPHLLLSGSEAVVIGPGLQVWRIGLG